MESCRSVKKLPKAPSPVMGKYKNYGRLGQSKLVTLATLSACLFLAPQTQGIPVLGPTRPATTSPTNFSPYQSLPQVQAESAAGIVNPVSALQYGQLSASDLMMSQSRVQSPMEQAQTAAAQAEAAKHTTMDMLAQAGTHRRTSLFSGDEQTVAQTVATQASATDLAQVNTEQLPIQEDSMAQTVRVPPKAEVADMSQMLGQTLLPQKVVIVDSNMMTEQLAQISVTPEPAPMVATPQVAQPQQPLQATQAAAPSYQAQAPTFGLNYQQSPMLGVSQYVEPHQQQLFQQSLQPPSHMMGQPMSQSVAQFNPTDFAAQPLPQPQQNFAPIPDSLLYESVAMSPMMVEPPKTLSQLTANTKAIETAPAVSVVAARTISPIVKPKSLMQQVQASPPTFAQSNNEVLNQAAAAAAAAAAASNEEIFTDAAALHMVTGEGQKLKTSRIFEQVHAFMNVAAVVAIISFVALQRNKSMELASFFIEEESLKVAFTTLCSQSVLLTAFSASIILSLWNMEMLVETTSLYIACECSLIITICWLLSGALVLRKAERQIKNWRSIEEGATDLENIKLKEQQYERLYYQVSRNPQMDIPREMVDELQHLVQRIHFLNPVYLPAMTESFLSKDFDFAEYLAQCHGRALNEHLKTHFVTMISCLPLVVLFFLYIATEPVSYMFFAEIEIYSTFVMNAILLASFTTLFAVFWYVKRDLDWIGHSLFPQILLDDDARMREFEELQNQCGSIPPPLRQPEALNLQHAMSSPDMFSPFDELPVPEYLEQESVHRISLLRFFVPKQNLETLSKHELLFGYSRMARYVPAGLLQIVQVTLTICVAWTIMALVTEFATVISLLGDTSASTQIPLRLILPIVQLNLLVAAFKLYSEWLPATLLTYTLATSTEMMKDRSVIESVIQLQKQSKNARNYRVLQAMRLMRREYMKNLFQENSHEEDSNSEYGEERTITSESSLSLQLRHSTSDKRLKEVTVKHILENFQKIGKPGDCSMRRSTSDGEDTDSVRNESYRYSNAEEGNWVVGVDKIHQLVSMCGGNLKKFESFYLLRRSNYGAHDTTQDITFNDFTEAVESYMNDANTDPYALVQYLFKLKFGEAENLLYMSDVKAFLHEFKSYFVGDDLGKFVRDIELEHRLEGDRIQVSQIASMIKHASEGFPK